MPHIIGREFVAAIHDLRQITEDLFGLHQSIALAQFRRLHLVQLQEIVRIETRIG